MGMERAGVPLKKAFEACLPYIKDNKFIKFLFLPDGQDPDSYVRTHGKEKFERYISQALPLSQFLLQEVTGSHDLTTAEGRAHAQHTAKALLQAMAPSALRFQIIQNLADLIRMMPIELEEFCELQRSIKPKRATFSPVRRVPPGDLQYKIIKLIILYPALALELTEKIAYPLKEIVAEMESLQTILDLAVSEAPTENFAAFVEKIRATTTEFDTFIAEISAQPVMERETARLELRGAIKQIKLKFLQTKLEILAKTGLKNAEQQAKYRELTTLQKNLKNSEE